MTANLLIIVLTVAVSLWGLADPRVIHALILWPPAVKQKGEVYRLLSYGVVHADVPHLLFNMITLYFFGQAIEGVYLRALGQLGYVWFYVMALLASILPTYLRHRDDPDYRSLGASGAVSAVLFAFILFQPWAPIYIFFIPIGIPAVVFAVLYVAYETWSQKQAKDNVNHSAHLWGAAFGVAFTLAMVPGAGREFMQALAKVSL
ncbi:MAG: rhomboid family intramembrane serine protease [Arenimonas sp.]